jgi:hypothetical protein
MYENIGIIIPVQAGGTVAKRRFVKGHSVAGQVVQSAAEGDLSLGVATEAAASGGSLAMQVNGVAKVTFAGTVGVWGAVEADGDGKAVSAGGSGAFTLGYAPLGGAAGEDMPVLLALPAAKGPANS